MNAIWQVLLALLAAVGLLALGWLTFGRLLTPVGGGGGGPVYAVVPASGDGAHLEQDVKGLLWLRGGELARFTIVIADGGLDGTGRAVAAALLARGQGIVLCPAERLGEYIKTSPLRANSRLISRACSGTSPARRNCWSMKTTATRPPKQTPTLSFAKCRRTSRSP